MSDEESKNKNSMKQLKEYLGCPGRPVAGPEMIEFWKSLTDQEKAEYLNAELFLIQNGLE